MPLDTHYEILGLNRRATQEQIDKAYQFLRQMYDGASLATYSLLDPEEARATRARLNHAYEALRDPARRQDYDLTLDAAAREKVLSFPPGSAGGAPAPEAPAGAAGIPPAGPEPPPLPTSLDGPVTGAHLRKFRERRGVSLQTIAASSKIGVRFLEYIEADRHSLLPARVYLRSFLHEYAKALGLEPSGVADAYMARVPKTDR